MFLHQLIQDGLFWSPSFIDSGGDFQSPRAALIGAGHHISLIEIFSNPSVVQPYTIFVGLTTIMAVFLSKRLLKAVPASLVGLAIGTAVFYALKTFGGISELGPVVGNFNFQWPKPNIFLNLSGFMTDIDIADLLPRILITGLVLGSIGSLESLLSSVAADNFTGTRHNSNRELLARASVIS